MQTRILILIAVLVLFPVIETLRELFAFPPLMLLAAAIPAALLSGLVVFLGRGTAEPRRLLLAVFLWGALVAPFFSRYLNDLSWLMIADVAGAERARALTPILAAPFVEEICKGFALWMMILLAQPHTFGIRGGMLYGALVGIGFAMTENLQYFLWAAVAGGPVGLGRSVYTRAVLSGLNHALFSACAGAALGWALSRARTRAHAIIAAMLGLVVAILLHVVWNAVASSQINDLLCDPLFRGGPCRGEPDATDLYLRAPLIELAFILPALALLRLAARCEREDATT